MGRGGLRTERGKRKKKEREREKQKQKTRNENRRENLQMKIVNQLPNQTQVWLLLLHPPGGGGWHSRSELGDLAPAEWVPVLFCRLVAG